MMAVGADKGMTENEQKQQLSVAYVHEVASRAGYACQVVLVDHDSVDVELAARGRVHQQSVLMSPKLQVQLKATSQDVLKADHVAFPLSRKNYDELRVATMCPRLLVVLLLPANPEEWLEQTEERMIMISPLWLPKDKVGALRADDVEPYLITHGWLQDSSKSSADVGVFYFPSEPDATVFLPRRRDFGDYVFRMADVVVMVAVVEQRPVWEVLSDLSTIRTGARGTSNGPQRGPDTASDRQGKEITAGGADGHGGG